MRNIKDMNDLMGVITEKPHYTAGIPVGIIAIDLEYPKLPGNVVNASTYDFPVLYEKVSFEIEALFRGDEDIKEGIVNAAKKLEAEGVRAIIGACGFFAHFQEDVKEAVSVPVYLSSLCQRGERDRRTSFGGRRLHGGYRSIRRGFHGKLRTHKVGETHPG